MTSTREESALHYVNQAREALHLQPLTKLPQGIQYHTCECVVARALYTHVSKDVGFLEEEEEKAKAVAKAWHTNANYLRSYLHPWRVKLPRDLSLFIIDFDAGLLPHLIQEDDQ